MLRNILKGSSSGRPSAHHMIELMKRVKIRDPSGSVPSRLVKSRDLFLAKRAGSAVCCKPGSNGANLAPLAASALYNKDRRITKRSYSAFENTNLLNFLRSRLVTELHLCGSLSNISVYSTASDAVQHGFSITIIKDCLGYRSLSAHEEALGRMQELMGANAMTASEYVAQFQAPCPRAAGFRSPVPEDSAKPSQATTNRFH